VFTLGCEDTRGEIHAQLGVSVVSCLPTRKGAIVTACRSKVNSPRAPEVDFVAEARAQVLSMCRRFIQRIDDLRKNWKFSAADIWERRFWPQHRKAYQACLTETCTVASPWYLVPADDKNNTC
jgi:hypothetical protein